jgi:AraC family transcriptional regulator
LICEKKAGSFCKKKTEGTNLSEKTQSPPATIIASSTGLGWQEAAFREVEFAESGTFDVVSKSVSLCVPLTSVPIRRVGQEWYHTNPAQVVLIMPEERMHCEWQGRYRRGLLSIGKNFIESFSRGLTEKLALEICTERNCGVTHVPSRRVAHLLSLLRADISMGSPDGGAVSEHLIYRILNNLFFEQEESPRRARSDSTSSEFKRIRDIVYAQMGDQLRISDLARASGMSFRQLSQILRAATGLSPHAYVMHCRVQQACALIAVGKLRLVEIALLCGFSDQAHMTVTFRKVLGFPPSHLTKGVH